MKEKLQSITLVIENIYFPILNLIYPIQVYRAEDILPLRPGFESMVYYREVLRKERFDGVYGLTTACVENTYCNFLI